MTKEKLIRIIKMLIHLPSTFRNYWRLEQMQELSDKIITEQGERIQVLEAEHEYFAETDRLFHHCEEQRRQLRQNLNIIVAKKERIKILETSNAFLTNEVEKLNKQIVQLQNQLQKNGKANH